MTLLLLGCLIERDFYEAQRAALLDGDGDGHTDVAEGGDDCDDTDATVFPGAAEVAYDEVDQDCSGADLTDVDGDGADAIEVGGADCDDADPEVGPDAEEVAYDGVDQDCVDGDLVDVDGDGEAAEVAGGGDCDDGDAGVGLDAEEIAYDGVDQDCVDGDLVDVDGDGDAAEEAEGDDCDDQDANVFVGATETWSNGFTDNDCDGDPGGTSTTFGADSWYGPAAGASAGANLTPLGDLDGDGAAEWAAAAVYDPTLYEYGGAVYVVTGSGGGPLTSQRAVYGGDAWWFTGTALDGGADLDGDGLPDLLIGATGREEGTGAAFVVSGAVVAAGTTLTLPESARATLSGVGPETFAGAQAVAAGDLDGDGVIDIAVSAPFDEAGGFAHAGRVYVLAGDVEGDLSLADAAWTWDGYFVDGALGNVLAPAGDQDGDGTDDLMISMGTGVVAWIAPGGGTGGTIEDLAVAAIYNTAGERIVDVAMVGDVDGDGTRDLVAHRDTAYVHIDLVGTPQREVEDAYATFGTGDGSMVYDAADLGDRDGDGLAETLLGVPYFTSQETGWFAIVPGAAWSFGDEVAPESLALTASSVRPAAFAGYRVAMLGDIDADGQDDLGVGATSDDEGGEDAGAVSILSVPR